MSSTEPDEPAEHVFDQTNGLVPQSEHRDDQRLTDAERDRRRRDSSALAYGMFGTGHQ